MEVDAIIEQCVVIKFLVKSGKTNTGIRNMITAVYGNNSMSYSTLYEWIGWFRQGHEAVADDLCKGRLVQCAPKTLWRVYKIQLWKTATKRLEMSLVVFHSTYFTQRFEHAKGVAIHSAENADGQSKGRTHSDMLRLDFGGREWKYFFTGGYGDESWVFKYDLAKKKDAYGLARARWAATPESLNEQITSEGGDGVLRLQQAGTPQMGANGFHNHWQGLCGHDRTFMGTHLQKTTSNMEGQLLDLASWHCTCA